MPPPSQTRMGQSLPPPHPAPTTRPISTSSNSTIPASAINHPSTFQSGSHSGTDAIERGSNPRQESNLVPTDSTRRSNTAWQRILQTNTSYIPHFATRIAAQMRYIDNSCVSQLRQHTHAVKKIFTDILQLQLKLPESARLHLLFESEHVPSAVGTPQFKTVDLFSLFSPTVSTESENRRDNISMLGELLVDFKHITDSDRHSAPPQTTATSNRIDRSTDRPTIINGPQDFQAPPSQNVAAQHTSAQTMPDSSTGRSSRPVPAQPSHARSTTDIPVGMRPRTGPPDEHDTDDLNDEWITAPDSIMLHMDLPDWFPSPKLNVTEEFKGKHLVVNVDSYTSLSYKDALFVYRAFIRTAHKKSLLPQQRSKYEGNKYFKSVFSFIPFTPPWFPHTLDCMVEGKSLFSTPLKFDEHCIPQMRCIRGNRSMVRAKLQGVIACFYNHEPAFAAETIDFLIDVCKIKTPAAGPATLPTTPTQRIRSRATQLATDIDNSARQSSAAPRTGNQSCSRPIASNTSTVGHSTNTEKLRNVSQRNIDGSPSPPYSNNPPPASQHPLPPDIDDQTTHPITASAQQNSPPPTSRRTSVQRPAATDPALDPPLSPHSEAMKAFGDRARRRTVKRKRAEAERLDGITANADSSESSSEDSDDSSDFIPPSQRTNSQAQRGKHNIPRQSKSKKVTPTRQSKPRRNNNNNANKKRKTAPSSTEPEHASPPVPEDNEVVYMGQVSKTINRFRTRHSQKSKSNPPPASSNSLPSSTVPDRPQKAQDIPTPPVPVFHFDPVLSHIFSDTFRQVPRPRPPHHSTSDPVHRADNRKDDISLPSSSSPAQTQPIQSPIQLPSFTPNQSTNGFQATEEIDETTVPPAYSSSSKKSVDPLSINYLLPPPELCDNHPPVPDADIPDNHDKIDGDNNNKIA